MVKSSPLYSIRHWDGCIASSQVFYAGNLLGLLLATLGLFQINILHRVADSDGHQLGDQGSTGATCVWFR